MTMNNNLKYYPEPRIEFGHSQSADDSRDGLTLFGPYKQSSGEVRIGVIGTSKGIEAYKGFASEMNKPVYTKSAGRPFFPGFQAVFGIKWPDTPVVSIKIPETDIQNFLDTKNLQERTYSLVSLYLDRITQYLRTEEAPVDLWYIVIPHSIWLLCRPKSSSGKSTYSKSRVTTFTSGQMTMFPEEDEELAEYIKMYESDSDFHDQFKARILAESVQTPVQIMLEETLQFCDKAGKPYSDEMKAHLLWTQSTSTYYKCGYLPWKLYDVRKGVCYIGLVFKTLQGFQKREGYACCAAQMFLDSGDGMVFRGNIGPWLSKDEKTYHLDKEAAKDLITVALKSYKEATGSYPKELFIHGRTKFSDEEWEGFCQAVTFCGEISLVGVTINGGDGLRLYKDTYKDACKYGIMRGLAMHVNDNSGYLWTKGYIPRTETANHMEVARPLMITVSRGVCDIDTVMRDILCLTKLNYNACIYGDGLPVTLRFSDKIGNILTALKDVSWPARQFKYYI